MWLRLTANGNDGGEAATGRGPHSKALQLSKRTEPGGARLRARAKNHFMSASQLIAGVGRTLGGICGA